MKTTSARHALTRKGANLLTAGILLSLLVLAVYIFVYYLNPLPTQAGNDNIIYAIILAAALAAAGFGTLLAFRFEKREPPRRIWLFFALGWWCWALGEAFGFVLRAIYPEEYPVLTANHFLWMLGYVFFAISLFLQLRLIYARKVRVNRYHFGLILLGILVLAAVIARLGTQPRPDSLAAWLAAYFGVFYPLCDFIFGAAALWLAFVFGRGIWARPWWGLIVFAFADGIFSWYWAGGYALLTPAADTWLSLFTDTLYVGGYIIGALGFLYIFLLNISTNSHPKEDLA